MKQSFDFTQRIKPIQHLVIHSFALSPKKMIEVLHQYKLSVHYLIEANGRLHSLVPEDKVAWHAGPSFWAGETGLNQTSIGIELEHLGYGQTAYPQKQIEALIKLVKEILARHPIRPENILGHSDIAPMAKMDPGRGFPWQKLAQNGIGLWYDLKKKKTMGKKDVAELLSLIGYYVKGRALEASGWAFRQRFMPESIPIDARIAEQEAAVFKARQQAALLPPKEQEAFLNTAPTIYPPEAGAYLTDSEFINVLKAVADEYQKARKA
ncbi:MAG: N-acetylmuramoyl-L-alanine amidase [Alphaproteobacteria bacterium]